MNDAPRSELSEPLDLGCREVRELLVPYLDGEAQAVEAERVETHLATCDDCRRTLEMHERIGEALGAVLVRAQRLEGTRASLADRVRLQVRLSGRRRRLLVLSAAAALLLMPLFLWWMMSAAWNPGTDSGPPVTEKSLEEQTIQDLDILEAFHEEGIEPSAELVNLLLEETDEGGSEILPQDLFDDFLEEEIAGENL